MLIATSTTFSAMRASGVFRQHQRGVWYGVVCGSLATMPLIWTTGGHGSRTLACLIGVVAWCLAFLLASPLLLGVLLSWRALTDRWPVLERRALQRTLGLVTLALLTAVSSHTILAVSAALADPDGFSLASARYRFVADRELFGLQAIAAAAWLLLPQVFHSPAQSPDTLPAIPRDVD